MKTVNILFSLLMLSAAGGPAMANPFAACSGVEAKKFLQEDAYVAFAKAFKKTFDRMARLSSEEINANKLCLSGDSTASDDCASRVAYFKKTLPLEWKKYRHAFALSSWNKQFLITKDSADGLLDMNPNGSALDQTERSEVLAQFQKETDLIFKRTLQELEVVEKKSKEATITNLQGRQLLTMKNWNFIMRSSNYWANKVSSRVEHLVFRLNEKRMLQQRLKHPILAFLNSKNLSTGVLFAAMDRMNQNLDEENALVSGIVTEVTSGSTWSLNTLFPLVDYLSVTETTLAENSSHCSAAGEIFKSYQNYETFKMVASLGVGIGLMFIAPPAIAIGGMVSIQAYSLYEANSHFELVQRGSLTNPDPELAMKSSESSYMASEQVKTEIMMSPLVMMGMSSLRFSKLLLVFI